MTKKLTVTIGIPAYNEGSSIVRLLLSIKRQKEESYTIKKIIVASDGSRDDTVANAQSVNDKRIVVIDDQRNRGRIFRLNQFMKMADTDILIFLDADEELSDNLALQKLIAEFNKGEKVALVGGNPRTVSGDSFLSKSLDVTRQAYAEMRYEINRGHNVYGCMGGMLAMKKAFYTNVVIPRDLYADDVYIYLTTIKRGYTFRNARKAFILHHMSVDLKSHVRRNKRYSNTKSDLRKYFGNEVDKEFFIPLFTKVKILLKYFLKYPLQSSFILVVNFYTKVLALVDARKERNYAY